MKPGNILIARQAGRDHVYLSDFGLTKEATSESGLTDPGQFVGTADYVAPEQIKGEPVDGRADVYSLGCVLVECLTGEPPFRSDRMLAALYAHVEQPPPSVRERRPELPAGIDSVVGKALAKRPADRFQSCGELIGAAWAELQLSGELPRAELPVRRRWRLVLLAVAAIAVVAASVIAVVFARGGEAESGPPPKPILPLAGNSVVRIDPKTNEVVAASAVDRPRALAVGDGAIWVIDRTDQKLLQLDPVTNAVTKTIDVARAGPPTSIFAAAGFVWTEHYPSGPSALVWAVWRYDPETDSFAKVESGPVTYLLDARDRAVWISDCCPSVIARVLPETGEVVQTLPLPEDVHTALLAPADGSLWAALFEGLPGVGGYPETISRIDPSTGAILATVDLGFSPVDLAAGEGEVWLVDRAGDAVVRIDAATGRLGDRVTVGRAPERIAIGEGAVWVTSFRDGTVTRIDPTSLDVTSIPVGGTPTDVAVGEGGVWVAVQTR